LASSKVDSLAATVGPPGQEDWAAAVKYDGDSCFPGTSGYEKEDSTNGEDPLVSTKDFSYPV
jgi:hypothetical protein